MSFLILIMLLSLVIFLCKIMLIVIKFCFSSIINKDMIEYLFIFNNVKRFIDF